MRGRTRFRVAMAERRRSALCVNVGLVRSEASNAIDAAVPDSIQFDWGDKEFERDTNIGTLRYSSAQYLAVPDERASVIQSGSGVYKSSHT